MIDLIHQRIVDRCEIEELCDILNITVSDIAHQNMELILSNLDILEVEGPDDGTEETESHSS